ncbi:MAG TPA: acryloyl-CoA reductase [Plasticicumulans sp.]|nr:acryloyl-CoA reductase [Plasticicumulans sp.]
MVSDAAFAALRAHRVDGRVESRLETLALVDLNPGDVSVCVAWSSLNYKDALACTGAGRIQKRFPLVGGIDLAGHVAASRDPRFREGDAVLVIGCGLGEEADGGYAGYANVCGDWLVPLPAGLTLREAMAIGTAGFTAALGIVRLEDNGQSPAHGPMLVSGATGGVGSFAIDLLAGLGYEVAALTGKPDEHAYLQQLGATQIVDRSTLDPGSRPLETARWGGAIDNLGGTTLAWLTRTIRPFGNIACIGLAQDHRLETSVMPLILRGISLIGINSTYCPSPWRARTWERLAADLKPQHLACIVTGELTLEALPAACAALLGGRATGRSVVRIGGG